MVVKGFQRHNTDIIDGYWKHWSYAAVVTHDTIVQLCVTQGVGNS